MPNYKSDLWASTVDLVNAQQRTNGSGGGSLNALYVSTATTYSSGATGTLWVDVNGNLKATLATKLAGEDLTNDVMKVEQTFSYTSFVSASTLLVKTGAGFLHLINIGMPSCPTITIYDSLTPSGTKIIQLHAGYAPGSYLFDNTFSTGLSLDTVGSGVVNPYIKVSYR